MNRFGFTFSQEQQLIWDTARNFARERLAPTAAERDRSRVYPTELMMELGSMGMLAMRVTQELGGAGIDATGYALALEGLSEGDSPFGAMVASSNLVASILFEYGSPDQHARWLRPYAEGKLGPGGYGLTEPEAGSDVAGMLTTARPVDGGYELNGSKMWITNGSEARIFLVFAKTDPADRRRGVSCFVVERGTPGFEVGKDEPKMGLRCSGTTALHFEGCRVERDNLLGDEGQGMAIALGALTPGRVGIAAQCVGIAEAAYREGLSYAAERRVFGKALTEFQNTQFLLADARMDVDLAWLAVLRAAALLDAGQPARMECSMAKLFASEACNRVVDRMLQLHGGYGFSEEYPIERLYRDCRVTRIYEGTSEVQRLVISREILRSL